MLKLTYGDVNHPLFFQAMGMLMQARGFSVKAAYNVAKLGEKLQKERNTMSDLYKKIADEFCDKNEKGEALFHPGTGEPCIPVEKRPGFDAQFKEFCEISFEVPHHKIPIQELEKIQGLSPQHLLAIEALISHLEAVPTAEASVTPISANA